MPEQNDQSQWMKSTIEALKKGEEPPTHPALLELAKSIARQMAREDFEEKQPLKRCE